MPSYFYHLNFELYPYPNLEAALNTKKDASPDAKLWVPPPGTNIFDSSAWPHPKPFFEVQIDPSPLHKETAAQEKREVHSRKSSKDVNSGGTSRYVIDCRPPSGTITNYDPAAPYPGNSNLQSGSPSKSAPIPRNLHTAVKE
jgi:BRCA1-associated protein